MQPTVTRWFCFLWFCMGEHWSCFLTPKFRATCQVSTISSWEGCTPLSMGACAPYHTRPRFLWIFVILPTLYRAQHYQKSLIFLVLASGTGEWSYPIWIPVMVSTHQSSPSLQLSLWGSLGVPHTPGTLYSTKDFPGCPEVLLSITHWKFMNSQLRGSAVILSQTNRQYLHEPQFSKT